MSHLQFDLPFLSCWKMFGLYSSASNQFLCVWFLDISSFKKGASLRGKPAGANGEFDFCLAQPGSARERILAAGRNSTVGVWRILVCYRQQAAFDIGSEEIIQLKKALFGWLQKPYVGFTEHVFFACFFHPMGALEGINPGWYKPAAKKVPHVRGKHPSVPTCLNELGEENAAKVSPAEVFEQRWLFFHTTK